MSSGVSPGWMMRAVMPSVQAEAETSSAPDFGSWCDQSPAGELVLDQPVGGRGIRHAQQRLGQHHQREALLGRERIVAQEILDAAEPAGMGADRLDQPRGARVDARLGRGVARRRGQQAPRAISSSGGA